MRRPPALCRIALGLRPAFLEQLEKPDVDAIEGLSPAIAIEQKTVSHNPRLTVGTVTEIYDYLRLLYTCIARRTAIAVAPISAPDRPAHC